ncbi:NADH dehydrogenase-like, partial [Tropilaelaps mercedesae]
MPYTEAYKFPSDGELTVEEINVSTPTLRATAQLMGRACDEASKEFMLCRIEHVDPRKCLVEGREVTACGLKFLQQMKKFCSQEVKDHATCLEWNSAEMHPRYCRKTEAAVDKCSFDNIGIERPHLGYFSAPRIHKTNRPKPVNPIAARNFQQHPSIDDAPPEIKDAPS